MLAHGRWFSPDSPASSTTKTGRHDIAEILLNVALNTINQNRAYLQQLLKWAYSKGIEQLHRNKYGLLVPLRCCLRLRAFDSFYLSFNKIVLLLCFYYNQFRSMCSTRRLLVETRYCMTSEFYTIFLAVNNFKGRNSNVMPKLYISELILHYCSTPKIETKI